MQASSASRRSSPRRRARKVEMAASTPRNTTTICLDGTKFNILQSYVAGMNDLDEWFRAGTEVVDVSGFFGLGHDIVRTRDGIFNMVFEYEGKFLTVPIEGRNVYLRGFSNEHGNFELDFGGDPKFVHDKRFTVLDIGVNYHDLLDESIEKTLTGMWPLRKAVEELLEYKGGSAKHVGKYVGALAIHISEAARSGVVHNFICRSIVDLNLSRLNAEGEDQEDGNSYPRNSKGVGNSYPLVIWIKKHRALSTQLLLNIDRMYKGEAPLPIKDFGLNLDLRKLVACFRVCHIDSYTKGKFEIKSTENENAPRRDPKEGGRDLRGGQELMPYKTQRAPFATTSSGMTQIQMMNKVTEGGIFQGGHRNGAQATGGQGLMPHKTQNELLMSRMVERTKAENPYIVKIKQTFRYRVDRILPKILSCKRPLRICQVGPPVTMGVVIYHSAKELLNFRPRKGGAIVVDRTNWSFCPGHKKAVQMSDWRRSRRWQFVSQKFQGGWQKSLRCDAVSGPEDVLKEAQMKRTKCHLFSWWGALTEKLGAM